MPRSTDKHVRRSVLTGDPFCWSLRCLFGENIPEVLWWAAAAVPGSSANLVMARHTDALVDERKVSLTAALGP